MTIEAGARKYEAKKGTMVQNYRLDPNRYQEGLRRAGLPSVRASRVQAYANSASYATPNYQAAIQGVTGAFWAQRFTAAMT